VTDREIKKTQSDRLFDFAMLQKAPASKRDDMLNNLILRTKASMTAEEVSHVLKMVEDAVV